MFKTKVVHADDDPPPLSALPDQVSGVKELQSDPKQPQSEGDGSHSTLIRKACITVGRGSAPSTLRKGFFNAVNHKSRTARGDAIKVGRPAAQDMHCVHEKNINCRRRGVWGFSEARPEDYTCTHGTVNM